jgi:hypothetical protein
MPPELTPDDLQTLIDYAWKKYEQERHPMSRELRPVREVLEKLEKLDPPQPPRPPASGHLLGGLYAKKGRFFHDRAETAAKRVHDLRLESGVWQLAGAD